MKTEKFIKKSRAVHQGTYDYSLVEYLHVLQKVKIICRIHGVFEQTPNSHLSGSGCKKCGTAANKKKQRYNTSDFTEKASVLHNDRYDYSKADYKNNKSKIIIGCPLHGEFVQAAFNHLIGQGCPVCSFIKIANLKRFSKEDFVEKARETHGDTYDYSKVVYVNSISDVEIICKDHGSFWQKANNHIFDRGCPSCAITGYRPSEAGYLYLMQCENITKIGITNLTPEHRSKDISRSYGNKFEVTNKWLFDDVSLPDSVETVILRYLRDKYERPSNKFEGSSECFLNVDQEDLLKKIKEELENIP